MKVAVFGCSYSAGIKKNDKKNWVRHFANLNKNLEIYNFSLGGSSLSWSLFQLKKYKSVFDKTIFQITKNKRFTYWDDFDSFEYFYKVQDNLYEFSEDIRNVVHCITPGMISDVNNYWLKYKQLNKDVVKFGEQIYKNINNDQFNMEYSIYIDHLIKISDLNFFHCCEESEQYNLSSIEGELKENFYNNRLDEANHLNDYGCLLQSNWVNTKFLDCINRNK